MVSAGKNYLVNTYNSIDGELAANNGRFRDFLGKGAWVA
jgi:hypothetical protein